MKTEIRTKHTPGPWKVVGKEIVSVQYYESHNKQVPASFDKVTVALAHGPSGQWENVGPIHEANARLIAAAPELLEALKALRDYYEFNDSDHHKRETLYNIGYAKMEAAIAKAEGR